MRTDTGTAATSGTRGRALWSRSQRRGAPVASAMTTSLTVQPTAFLTCLTCSSDRLRNTQRRCGLTERLNGVGGARNPLPCSTTPLSRPSSRSTTGRR
ncbi:MAG: hypothetical protein M3P93_14980, partial [Actinomycetota bacterium]|nr:hypothetical protein [Actinomycetota bacterium]